MLLLSRPYFSVDGVEMVEGRSEVELFIRGPTLVTVSHDDIDLGRPKPHHLFAGETPYSRSVFKSFQSTDRRVLYRLHELPE